MKQMKHLDLFVKSLSNSMSYKDYLDQAVNFLNMSASEKRNELEPTHVEERQSIIDKIKTDFPDITEEQIVVDIVGHPNIRSQAVDDYMYYNHRTFPGHKACLAPTNFSKAKKLGLHIVRRMGGNLFEGTGVDVEDNTLPPQTDLGYFHAERNAWVTFRVADEDLYRATKAFEVACITNELPFKGGRKSEFEKVMDYLEVYRELNLQLIPKPKQYNYIGWNENKTQFVNPRDKDIIINLPSSKHKRMLKYGYVQKGNDPSMNVSSMLNILKEHPLSLIVYTAPFINTIIDGAILNNSCIVIDIYGKKGKGKNLLQYVAMNPIGVSSEKSPLMQTWVSASQAGGIADVRPHGNHPVFLEESHMASVQMLNNFIYQAFNSTIGGKATVDGTSRDDGRLSSIIISSGEESIFSRVTVDGVTRRGIPLNIDDVFASVIEDPRELKQLQVEIGNILNESYGIAIDPFVEYACQNETQLKEIYADYIDQYTTANTSILFDHEKHAVYSKYIACIHLVLDTLIELYTIETISKEEVRLICSEIHEYCMELCLKNNKDIEALDVVYGFATKNMDKHFLGNNRNHAQLGYFDKVEINGEMESCLFFETQELKKLLADEGFVVENTIKTWESTGAILTKIVNKGNGKTAKVSSIRGKLKKGQHRPYCTVFILSRVQELIDEMRGGVVDVEFHDEALPKSNVIQLQI